MRFSLTGEDGSFVSLEELAFRADKPGEYALYYQMSGSAEGEIFSVSGAVTLVIQPIDLADVIDARLDVEGDPQYPNYEVLYDGDAPQTSDILILDAVQAIEAWGGYRLSLADLTVTFIDRNGASHTGVVDLQMEDGSSWLEITEVLVQWDEYHTSLSFDGFEWFTYWYKSYIMNGYGPEYVLDNDWQTANLWEGSTGVYVNGGTDDLDDTLRIIPYLLDGYTSDFSGRQFGSAFEEVGLVRLDWELLVEFYDYDGLAAGLLNAGEKRHLSGSMNVTADTTAEDLALLVEALDRVGAYFIGIAYTGYNAEGTQLFAATDYLAIRTPISLNLAAEEDTQIYYDGREHTIALDGLEKGDILEVRYQEVDAQTGDPTGSERTEFYYIAGFAPDTLAPLGIAYDPNDPNWYPDFEAPQVAVLPAFLGDALRDSAYRIAYTVTRDNDMGAFAAMSLRSTSAFEDSDIPRNQLLSIFPLYTPFHNEAQLTIKGSAHQEIAGVSAEGYEGLADGQKHGFTIHGLKIDIRIVLDTVRITVRDAQGNPVTGLEDISLNALAGVTVGADGAVYVPLLSEMGAYQIEYTVERGLLFKPFAATASLNLLKGTTVIGVDTSVLYDGKEHTIGLDNLDGAQVVSWWTSVDGTPTAVQPTFTEEGVYTIYFEARRELTGEQGSYLETYLGSAVLEIRPFGVAASGWTGVYDGASHGVTLNDIDWSSDRVEYAVGSGAFVSAASAADLPAFTESGDYDVVLRVTRENATLDIPVWVRILPRRITGVTAETVRGYADGRDYAISVEGIPQGVEIFYIVNGVETQENPAYRDAGSYEVNFVLRGPNYEDYYGFGLIDIRALSGIVSEGYEGIWDGKAHTIELYGPEAEDVVYYRVGENGEETTVKPQFTDVGKYTIYYRVERYLNGVFSHTDCGMETINILPLNNPTIVVQGYSGEYDGAYHDGVTFTGDLTGVTVRYFDNDTGTWLTDPPRFKDAGEHAITVALVNAMGETFSVQPVTVSIRQRQLTWDISGLELEGITKVEDGDTGVGGVQGTLAVDGVLEGDSVNLLYSGYLTYLLNNDLGQDVPAAIEFYGLDIDNLNYALPEDALFTFRVRHIPGLPATLPIPNETYDGSAHEPEINLSGLIEGVDYRIDGYENNVEAGTATIHVSGAGALAGQNVDYTFVIDPAALPQPDALADQPYTGSAIEPPVIIAGLLEGRDYTVRYENNVQLGTATAIVTGIGNYIGNHTLHFAIIEGGTEPAPEPTPGTVPGSTPAPETTLTPAPQTGEDGEESATRRCSIVTNINWQPEEYRWQTLWLRVDGVEESARVLVIDALPALDADGNPVLREDGTPLYELRNLHLSTALLACLKNEGYAYVLFRLGDAVLLIPLGKLEDANHIFTLEPILLGEETAVEQEAFANLVLLDDLHRVCVRVDGAIVELKEVALLLGEVWELPATPPESAALRIFCEETAYETLDAGQTVDLLEEADAAAPFWRLRAAPLPQIEAQRLTFSLVSEE